MIPAKRGLDFCYVIFLIVVFSSDVIVAIQNKYCQLPCEYFDIVPHTVCDRQEEKCGPSPACGEDFRIVPFTDDDRQYILDIHNYLRNKLALGYETRGNQPPASNMNIMRYNKEIEFIAQCWANTCNGNPLTHDHCRRTEIYDHVGQNLGFINSSTSAIDIVDTIKELILLWYDEVEMYNNTWIHDTEDRGPDFKVGHYTQLIWSDSREIGCAAAYYTTENSNRKWHHIVFVCNYGPGGNYLGLPVYEIGKPCSNCPDGLQRNSKYKGLCGKEENVRDTKFEENSFFDFLNFFL